MDGSLSINRNSRIINPSSIEELASIKRQIIEITINSVQNLISNTKNIQASDMIFKGFLEKIPGTISNSSYKKD